MGRFRPRGGTDGKPSDAQLSALEASWCEYFRLAFRLTNYDVFGHFEAKHPKKACPGDILERWVLAKREAVEAEAEIYEAPIGTGHLILLDTWKRRQAALVMLGFDLGSYGPLRNGVDGDPGYKTRAAIEGLEESLGLSPDGVWDDRLEFLARMMLFTSGVRESALEAAGSEM
jgi:hypothetical protein